jgi:hypothetical protein
MARDNDAKTGRRAQDIEDPLTAVAACRSRFGITSEADGERQRSYTNASARLCGLRSRRWVCPTHGQRISWLSRRASSDHVGRYMAMVSNDHALSLPSGMRSWVTDWGRVPALLALLMVSGCETLDRMDYLDRFFEPAAYARSVDASERWPTTLPPSATQGDPQPEAIPTTAALRDPAPSVASDPVPRPSTVRALEQPANPPPPSEEAWEAWTRRIVRENRWLTQFWAELTPAQQLRIERRIQHGTTQLAAEHPEPEAVWDTMGLADRAVLAFGANPPFDRPVPAETRNASVWADRPSSVRRSSR